MKFIRGNLVRCFLILAIGICGTMFDYEVSAIPRSGAPCQFFMYDRRDQKAPSWKTGVTFVTYDDHDYYDHLGYTLYCVGCCPPGENNCSNVCKMVNYPDVRILQCDCRIQEDF